MAAQHAGMRKSLGRRTSHAAVACAHAAPRPRASVPGQHRCHVAQPHARQGTGQRGRVLQRGLEDACAQPRRGIAAAAAAAAALAQWQQRPRRLDRLRLEAQRCLSVCEPDCTSPGTEKHLSRPTPASLARLGHRRSCLNQPVLPHPSPALEGRPVRCSAPRRRRRRHSHGPNADAPAARVQGAATGAPPHRG